MTRRRTGVLIVGMMLFSACGSPAMVDGQPGIPIDPNPFLALLPALRSAPAPGWVKPGTRITYESAAASLSGHAKCHEEPTGEWRDDQGRICPEGPGSGRRGLTQVTVVALDQQVAVLDLQIYTLTNGTGPAVTSGFMGSVGVPGAGVDWWLNPQVLRGAVGLSAQGLKVLQMRYPIGGREYNAVRFQTWDQTANQAWVFDADSGVLLHSGNAQTGRGATLLTQNTLLGARAPSVPWALSPAPDWVNRTSVLRYQGSTTFYVPGAAPVSVPVSATFQRQTGGLNWVRYLQKTVQATPPGLPPSTTENLRITGSGQFGGLWIPPQGLSPLRPGQTLDVDPITGMTTSVGQVGRTPQGAETVTITESNQGQRVDSVYDKATGAMLSVSVMDNILRAQIQFQLVGRQ